MTLLQRQSYLVWYSFLMDKLLEWQKEKPNNKDLKNCAKAITQIGLNNNLLQTELEIQTKKESLTRQEKNKQILKLEQELKTTQGNLDTVTIMWEIAEEGAVEFEKKLKEIKELYLEWRLRKISDLDAKNKLKAILEEK